MPGESGWEHGGLRQPHGQLTLCPSPRGPPLPHPSQYHTALLQDKGGEGRPVPKPQTVSMGLRELWKLMWAHAPPQPRVSRQLTVLLEVGGVKGQPHRRPGEILSHGQGEGQSQGPAGWRLRRAGPVSVHVRQRSGGLCLRVAGSLLQPRPAPAPLVPKLMGCVLPKCLPAWSLTLFIQATLGRGQGG